MDVKYSQINPRTNSFYWTGTVISIGGKEFIENEAKSAHVQVAESDGNVSFIPVVQREDPNMTQYENVSQLILNEDLEQQNVKRIKIVTASQATSSQSPAEEGIENVRADDSMCVTLNPEELSVYLTQVEKNKANEVNRSNVVHNEDANASDLVPKLNTDVVDNPKHSSTPANRKIKRTKTIDPEDLTEMEVRRADLEALTAIKETAEKITHAAEMIVNCMQELEPEIKSLANRKYREIQMSTNAVKQLVSFFLFSFLSIHIQLSFV